MVTQLSEFPHVDEPDEGSAYADLLTKVAADRQGVVVRRGGADFAAVVPLEFLDLLFDTLAREEAMQLARNINWNAVNEKAKPPQSWFDGDEPKPF
ncbi:MAG: hypothetical protein EXS16_06455 [Gemmataceae bacterium]|nr:hypothetical protein [Gemmataceae bacterium]